MCGIAGILRIGEKPLPEKPVIERMLKTITYRGPDESGIYSDEFACIGTTRLSIIDIENGKQPVRGCTPEIVCCVNGEIYNYQSLRAELSRTNHVLHNSSDSAVIPHVYEEYGYDFVNHLNGMFAICLWDKIRRQMILIRDRVGIKPLFYSVTEDYLLFASEIKAIAATGLVPIEIDFESLSDLFSMGYPISPRTMFKRIFEIRPAHYLTVKACNKNLTNNKYWYPPFVPNGEHRKISLADAAQEFNELMLSKVKSHLQSDVPVACFLSGGIDSSAISMWAKKVNGIAPATFSLGFDLPEFDESSYSKIASDFLSSKHESFLTTNKMADRFIDFIWHVELPMIFPVGIPLWMLSERVREKGYKVVLSGEGADEIFGGYDCFKQFKINRLFDSSWLKPLRSIFYNQLYKWRHIPTEAISLFQKNSSQAKKISLNYKGLYPPWYDIWSLLSDSEPLFNDPTRKKVRTFDDVPCEISNLTDLAFSSLHPFDQALSFEMSTRLPSWILLNTDRVTMAAGIENRVPFLDHEVIEFVAPLHPEIKMRRLTEKTLLRKAVSSSLPLTIVNRPKRPFFVPIKEYFFTKNCPEFVEHYLSKSKIMDTGIFNFQEVCRLKSLLTSSNNSSLTEYRMEWKLLLTLGVQVLLDSFRVQTPEKI